MLEQLILNGLIAGSIYSLIALSFTIIGPKFVFMMIIGFFPVFVSDVVSFSLSSAISETERIIRIHIQPIILFFIQCISCNILL